MSGEHAGFKQIVFSRKFPGTLKNMYLVPVRQWLLTAIVVIALAACTSQPPKEVRKVMQAPPAVLPAPKKIPRPKPLTGVALINSLLPPTLADRNGWAADIFAVFEVLKIAQSKENICAVLAEIGQESSFQTDPVVFGLTKIVRAELEANRIKYGISKWLMDSAFEMKSPTGRSYYERIDALRTENDLYELYEDMISEVPFGKKFLSSYNPVQTIGPMQVSLSFANEYAATRRYPYAYEGSLRNALVTRKGGLYFGVAYLLDYPTSYDSLIFRFADFNAGRYSSRNAAFQKALSSLSNTPLKLDGDLLRYKDGTALQDDSRTMRALITISSRLKMSKADIYRDLLLEKSPAFERSQLYMRVVALAPSMPHAHVPEIVVGGPKTSGRLTTALYTKKVDGRYRRCLSK